MHHSLGQIGTPLELASEIPILGLISQRLDLLEQSSVGHVVEWDIFKGTVIKILQEMVIPKSLEGPGLGLQMDALEAPHQQIEGHFRRKTRDPCSRLGLGQGPK